MEALLIVVVAALAMVWLRAPRPSRELPCVIVQRRASGGSRIWLRLNRAVGPARRSDHNYSVLVTFRERCSALWRGGRRIGFIGAGVGRRAASPAEERKHANASDCQAHQHAAEIADKGAHRFPLAAEQVAKRAIHQQPG